MICTKMIWGSGYHGRKCQNPAKEDGRDGPRCGIHGYARAAKLEAKRRAASAATWKQIDAKDRLRKAEAAILYYIANVESPNATLDALRAEWLAAKAAQKIGGGE